MFARAVLCLILVATAAFAYEVELKRRVAPDQPRNLTLRAHMQLLYQKYARQAEIFHDITGKHLRAYNGTLFQKRAKGSSVLQSDHAWSGEMEIGTPAKKIMVVFDTGSADLVLDSNSYDPKSSKTSENLHKKFKVVYGDQTTYGDLYSDTVAIGGVKARHVAVGHGAKNFNGDVTGGTFGLAFPSLSTFGTDTPSFSDAVHKEHPNQKNTYQFTMRSNGKSILRVGEIDESDTDGGFLWTNVKKEDMFWKATVKINGKPLSGFVDSGTTLITGPNDGVKDLLESIDGVSVFKDKDGTFKGTYDCNNAPKIVFDVAGKKLPLNEGAMRFGIDGDKCTLAITGTDGLNDWIFGDPFFQAASIVFDFDKERLGFGKQSK